MRAKAAAIAPSGNIRRLLATTGLMTAAALQATDALIVNVALPQLQSDLGDGIALGTWVMTSYLCASAVAAPFTAWLRRRYGARQVFPGAVAVFIATSLLCAAAPSPLALILFRVLQGAASGVILPLVQAMLLDIYPQERHGRIMGLLGAVMMSGPILGPPLGGLITDLASWRAVFLINLPLGLAVISAVWVLRHEEQVDRSLPADAAGMLLLSLAVGALQLCLERGVGRSWLGSPELLLEAAVGVTAFAAIYWRSRRTGFSIFRLDVFTDLNFVAAGFYNFMVSGLLFVTLVLVPALGEEVFGFSATLAGVAIVPRAVLMMLGMLAVGEMLGRVDYRILLTLGWVMTSIGLFILSEIDPATPLLWLILGSTVQAVGAAILIPPHSTLAFSTLTPTLRTDASGLYSLLRQLGFASGVALMTAVLRLEIAGHRDALGLVSAPVRNFDLAALLGYRDCFRMMAIASLVIMPGILLFRAAGAAARRGGTPIR